MKKVKACAVLVLICLLLPFWQGSADRIQAQVTDLYYFTILHTNDEHSALIPHSSTTDHVEGIPNPSIGGFARLATAVRQIQAEKARSREPVVILNGGDFLGGTAFSWLVPRGYAAELYLMQKIGYHAVTLGNHEYDYNTDVLTNYLIRAGYPAAHNRTAVIASNTLIPENHPMHIKDLYRTYHVLELENGLRMGLFGLIGIDAVSVAPEHDPFTFGNQTEAARKAVEHFQGLGVDLIVALSHSGVDEDVALARAVPGIHIIIGGHCHTALHQPVVEGKTVIVQAGGHTEFLGRIEFAFRKSTGELTVRNEDRPFLIPLDSSVPEDPEILTLIEDLTGKLNLMLHHVTWGNFSDIHETLMYSDFSLSDRPRLQETTFGNFVTDAMRIVTSQVTGDRVDVALMANGNIRGSLHPGTAPHSRGAVSFYDLTKLVGLGYGQDGYGGYPIVSFWLTEEEVRRLLEVAALLAEFRGDNFFLQFSGLRYDYNPKDAVLFTVPFVDIPLPSSMAVKNVYFYTGEGIQPDRDGEGFVKLDRKSTTLRHVVTDSYILSFLPMIGDLLPSLSMVPKDKNGNPIPFEEFNTLVVTQDGRELKLWHTVAQYASIQPLDSQGNRRIADAYRETAGRIYLVDTFPLAGWLIVILAVLIIGMAVLIVWRIKTKKIRKENRLKKRK